MHGNRQASSGDQHKPAGIHPSFRSDPQSRPLRTGVRQRAWLAAILTAGFALPAEAQMYWPMDPGPDYAEPPRIEQRRPRIVRSRQKLPDAPKDTAKPVGPIVIAISIEKQQLKLYDRNGLFAETPVSTGMRGHSTPMGVFSIIQKNKYHRSNIYSNAPMPYMQRITWSGVAMHAGVLPGYPASHGCIRMPMNFAMRMWGWTRMGARVIVTPGEVSPADFSHPLLIARKPESKPVAAAPDLQHHAATTPKSDRSSIVDAAFDKTDLRLTSIHDRSGPIRTADASGAMSQKDDAGTRIAQAWDAGRDGSPQPTEAPQGGRQGHVPRCSKGCSQGRRGDERHRRRNRRHTPATSLLTTSLLTTSLSATRARPRRPTRIRPVSPTPLRRPSPQRRRSMARPSSSGRRSRAADMSRPSSAARKTSSTCGRTSSRGLKCR